MICPPQTLPINGLVGHLTQPLNHDCVTNEAWVLARIALLRPWMEIPSATRVEGFWQTVPLWRVVSISKKIDTTTQMPTG